MVNTVVEVKEFPNGSHALLSDDFDLLDAMLTSQTFTPRVQKPVDFPYPSESTITAADKDLQGLRKAFSPVFLHVDSDGSLKRGLAGIPVGTSGRPVLLVGNHQLIGNL